MKILCITDLHDNPPALARIVADAGPVEAILFGGDITNFGSPRDAERLIRLAQNHPAMVMAVAGNCDSAEIDRRLLELGVSLAGRGVIHDGIGLHGLPAMPPWRSHMYHFTEQQLGEILRAGYEEIAEAERHVVLSHAPPRTDKLDRTRFFKHVGSVALREFIDETQPDLVLCGHIHEARGTEQIGRTTVVNCGPAAAGFYALAEVEGEIRIKLRRA